MLPKISFILLFLIPTFTQAQFQKGEAFLGGTASLSNLSGPSELFSLNSKQISFAPMMGILLNRKFALGVQLGYTSSTGTGVVTIANIPPIEYENKSSSYSMGLLGRWYYTISDKFLFAFTGSMNFTKNKAGIPFVFGTPPSVGITNQEYNQTTLALQPSFIFFPSPRWGFEAALGNINYTKTYQDQVTTSIKLNYGLTLGFAYYFRKTTAK